MFSYNDLEIKKAEKIADRILMLDKKVSRMSDEDLRKNTRILKKMLSNKQKTLDEILVRAFASCREATWRVLGKKQYKVQLIGGIILSQGRIAEMKTGEGKTVTELCPAYLNALTGEGVHIVTVNDYLSKRDFEEMKEVFEFLGLSVGFVSDEIENKKEEYSKDITYTTSSQIGFDYLGDNLVENIEDKVLRSLNYIIIDEIDSVLIDEAQTPLIIAESVASSNKIYRKIAKIIKFFKEHQEYEYDRKESAINFTEKGYETLEKILSVNLLNVKNIDILHYCNQTLRAEKMLIKNKDYIVRENEIVIIDQNTGRLAEGRRFSDGLHQAIEAKEGLELGEESETVASITYSNLFNMYKKVSGMSGTVKTDEDEFKEIYNLDVVVIPTNKPVRRIDKKDVIVGAYHKKIKLIIDDIISTNRKGQPVLVCSQSIKQSIEISNRLKEENIDHKLLTAYSKSEEAEIIKEAGKEFSITVSTNIAGRGTDIKLTNKAKKLGGLKVIGTERSVSRRIDNQLVGRAGRRGEPGISQFYVSFEDELFENYTIDSLKGIVSRYRGKSTFLRDNKFIKIVDKLQKFYQSMVYEERKERVKYDEVINKQRTLVYTQRDTLLKLRVNEDMNELFVFLINTIKEKILEILDINEESKFIILTDEMIKEISSTFNIAQRYFENYFAMVGKKLGAPKMVEKLVNLVITDTNEILQYFELEESREYIINTILSVVDRNWKRELNILELDKLKVKNQSFNQKDPAIIFKFQAFESYQYMLKLIRDEFIENWFYTILNSMKYKLGRGFVDLNKIS
ncbi:MAG: DEAD/DEAH box helicase [Sarcina sp.]